MSFDSVAYSRLLRYPIALANSDATKFWKLSSADGSEKMPCFPPFAFERRKQAESYRRSLLSLDGCSAKQS